MLESESHLASCNKGHEIGNGAHEFAPQNDTGRFVCRGCDVTVDSKCCEHEECYDKRTPFAADLPSYQHNDRYEQHGCGVDPDKLDPQGEPADLVQRDLWQGIDVHRDKQAGSAIKQRREDDLL